MITAACLIPSCPKKKREGANERERRERYARISHSHPCRVVPAKLAFWLLSVTLLHHLRIINPFSCGMLLVCELWVLFFFFSQKAQINGNLIGPFFISYTCRNLSLTMVWSSSLQTHSRKAPVGFHELDKTNRDWPQHDLVVLYCPMLFINNLCVVSLGVLWSMTAVSEELSSCPILHFLSDNWVSDSSLHEV